jgi:hypothetical protein
MNWLVSTALNLRVIVLALAVLLLIVGLRVVQTAPLDVFPRIRAAAGRNPNRSAWPFHRRGRKPASPCRLKTR